jgi:hypothetical protein
MSKIKVKLQINCSLVTHPAPSLCVSQNWSGVGFLAHLLSPKLRQPKGTPPTAKSGLVGVPRSLDGAVDSSTESAIDDLLTAAGRIDRKYHPETGEMLISKDDLITLDRVYRGENMRPAVLADILTASHHS